MPAKYVLAQRGSGYHWNLLATNGRVIASSETYNSKAAAMAGIRSVQKNGSTDVVVTADDLKETRSAARKTATARTKAAAGKAAPATEPAAKAPAKAPAKKTAAKKVATKAATKAAPAKRSRARSS
jgi:uncharacterized protein YegP (UPF0339 family)